MYESPTIKFPCEFSEHGKPFIEVCAFLRLDATLSVRTNCGILAISFLCDASVIFCVTVNIYGSSCFQNFQGTRSLSLWLFFRFLCNFLYSWLYSLAKLSNTCGLSLVYNSGKYARQVVIARGCCLRGPRMAFCLPELNHGCIGRMPLRNSTFSCESLRRRTFPSLFWRAWRRRSKFIMYF